MRIYTYLLIMATIMLFSCHNNSSQLDKNQSTAISQKEDLQDKDPQMTALIQRRKELEKQGFNYSSRIISDTKIIFNNTQLIYIQDLIDSTNTIRGKVYVQLLNDSVFKKLYVINNDNLEYYVGDGILANSIDTTKYDMTYTFGFKFTLRYKSYVVIECVDNTGKGVSDSWTIQYLDKDGTFDNPYKI